MSKLDENELCHCGNYEVDEFQEQTVPFVIFYKALKSVGL